MIIMVTYIKCVNVCENVKIVKFGWLFIIYLSEKAKTYIFIKYEI